MDTSAAAIHARIEECRIAAGISIGDLDRAVPHVRKNVIRGSVPAIDKLVAMAAALQTTPGYLAFGAVDDDDMPTDLIRGTSFPPLATVPIIGEFAAGRWQMVDEAVDESPYDGIAVPPDPRYAVEHQFAGVVRGTSVNRAAPDGAIVSGLLLHGTGVRPVNGDLVAVEQTKNAGQERMRTIKRYRRIADAEELWPDSDDPRWREPLRITRDPTDESTTIVILGVVTWVHRRLDPSERTRV